MKKLLIAAFLLGFCTANADVELGVLYSTYGGEELRSSTSGISVQYQYKRAYIRGTYEQPKYAILGQQVGNPNVYGLTVGGDVPIRDGLYLFGEVGYFGIGNQVNKAQEFEAITNVFRNDFTPEPWQPFGDPYTFEHTSLKMYNSLGYRLGVKYKWKHATISAGYRVLGTRQRVRAWVNFDEYPKDAPVQNCCFVENANINLGAFELTASVRI